MNDSKTKDSSLPVKMKVTSVEHKVSHTLEEFSSEPKTKFVTSSETLQHFLCPTCNGQWTMTDRAASGTARCPHCGIRGTYNLGT